MDAPEPVPSALSPEVYAPEVYNSSPAPAYMYDTQKLKPSTEFVGQEDKEVRIFGLRRATFFLSIALVIVVLVSAIGGGVGGTLAVQNARKSADCEPQIVTTATTTMVMTATNPGATPPTGLAAAAITVPTTGEIDFDCGTIEKSRQVVTLGERSWGFDVDCMTDFVAPRVDITGMTTYRFQDCLKACALYNRFAGNNTCLGVVFAGNLTQSIPANDANCWLKSYLPQMSRGANLSAAASLVTAPRF